MLAALAGKRLTLSTFAEFGAQNLPDGDLLHGYWEKLSASRTAIMPLQKQVWGDEFGMCVDKFGVSWLVNISQPQV